MSQNSWVSFHSTQPMGYGLAREESHSIAVSRGESFEKWRKANPMNSTAHRIVFCLIGMALVTACASLPSQFYTLSPSQETLAGSASSATVAVGPVSIPESVNRPEMVVQVGPNQVALDEFNRWASPLQADIQRVLIENLTQLLGTPRVFRYPQGQISSPDFRVEIHVLRFESAPGNAAILDVIWTVSGKSEKNVKTGRTTLREPLTDKSYDTLVASHSRALGTLSRDLADAILTLERLAE